MHLKINIPTKLTEKQRKLIEEFADEAKEEGSATTTKKSKTTSTSPNEHHNILNEAWKRVKEFLHKSEKTEQTTDTKVKEGKENAKAKM